MPEILLSGCMTYSSSCIFGREENITLEYHIKHWEAEAATFNATREAAAGNLLKHATIYVSAARQFLSVLLA